jgi:hypothetical protein
MGRGAWDWLALAFVATLIYVLVRPKSHAVDLVVAMGDFIANLVSAATDLASDSSSSGGTNGSTV